MASPSTDESAPATAPVTESSQWSALLLAAAASFYEWISRPRVRLTVTGVVLLLIGGLLTNSVWTLPLVVGGALMVAIAWIGGRLDGRFAVEWGESGAQLEFRAGIRAAQLTAAELTVTSHELMRRPDSVAGHTEVIDGEAHTVEIDVAELRALIDAAETTSEDVAQADASAQAARSLRVAHGGSRSFDAR